MRKIIKESLIVLLTTLTIFLLVDFFLGDKILNIFNVKKDNSFRIPNNIFNHGFKKNYKTDNAFWGPHQYKFCTSEHGTRNDCSTNNMKKFDYAFIGDSQTEGVGLNFEDTYVGNFAKENKLNVINFGIVRSSPSLYYKRLKFFLNQEIKFKELFILIDISDLHDELKYNKNIFKNDKTNVCKSINSVNITNKFETIRNTQKIINTSFKIKRIVKENFKILYTLSELIWWKMSFKKIFSNYSNQYLEKNYYRSAWSHNNNLDALGGPACLDYLIESSQNIVNEIYNLLNFHNIKLSIIVSPWPGNILHDVENSKHVTIWKNFCKNRCNNFINLFPYFFDYSKRNGKIKTINDHFFDYDVHYNKFANKIISKHISKNVKK